MNTEDVLFLVVEGEPVPKGRPRVTSHGTYTPHRTVAAEELLRLALRERYPGLAVDGESPFALSCTFYRHWRTRFDGDNGLKLVADALIGEVYADDVQVVEWHARIVQGELLAPMTVILVTRLAGVRQVASKKGKR